MDSCQSQCSWQVSARAVIRSGVGLVSGVDRSPALRLLWVLSSLSVPAAPPSVCPSARCTADSAPSVLLSATGLDSSATPKPCPPAGCQKTCPSSSSAHLSSAYLLPPQPSSPQLSSPPLGAPSWPASLGLTSRVEPPATPSTLPPAGMVGQGLQTSRCSTCRGPDGPCGALFPACATLTSRTPQWTHPSNSSTCEPPVIDL